MIINVAMVQIVVLISNFFVIKYGFCFVLGDCWIMGCLYSGELGQLLDTVLYR